MSGYEWYVCGVLSESLFSVGLRFISAPEQCMSDLSCTTVANDVADSARHKIGATSLKAFSSFSWLMPVILSVISCAMVVLVS